MNSPTVPSAAGPTPGAVPRSRWVLAALLVAFLTGRLVIWAGAKIATYNDTFSYAYRDDPAYDRGPLISLTGHAPRLWGTPLFYALFPNDAGRAAGQWAVGTLAWAALAVALWVCLRSLPARLLGASSALMLGLTPQVVSWDFVIISESLSISLGVLTAALFLLWRHSRSHLALSGMVAVAVWWTFIRQEVRIPVVLLILVLAWYAWRAYGRRVDEVPRRGQWIAAAAATGVLALAIGWVTVITPTVSTTFAGWSATRLSLEEETLNYRLRLMVFPDPQMKRVFQRDLGMPDCPEAARIAAGQRWAIREFAQAYRDCPDLKAWGEQNATRSAYRFPLAAPGLFGDFLYQVLPSALAGAVYARVPSVLPSLVERAYFPASTRKFPASPRRLPASTPQHLLLGVGLLLATAAAVAAGGLRRRALLLGTAVDLTLCSVATLTSGLLLSVGEYGRFGLQEAVGLRLALIVMAVTAADALAERLRARRSAADVAAGTQDATVAVQAANR